MDPSMFAVQQPPSCIKCECIFFHYVGINFQKKSKDEDLIKHPIVVRFRS